MGHVVVDILVLLLKIVGYYLEAFYRLFVPPWKKSVTGKVAVVTGAGQGIGREFALQLAALGVKVALWDIDQTRNDSTAADINGAGGNAKAYVCDVSNVDNVRRAARETRRDFGNVDILVNNAGIGIGKEFLQLEDSDIQRTININTVAYLWTTREFLPSMIENSWGHVINVCSIAAEVGLPFLTDYCASKYALNGFTEALTAELQGNGIQGIHFTRLYPAFVGTNMLSSVEHRVKANVGRFGRMLKPAEVAEEALTGMLRNQKRVFVPAYMGSLVTLGWCMPQKATNLMWAFTEAGFRPATAE